MGCLSSTQIHEPEGMKKKTSLVAKGGHQKIIRRPKGGKENEGGPGKAEKVALDPQV